MARVNGWWPWRWNITQELVFPEEAKQVELEKNPYAQPIPNAKATESIRGKVSTEHMRLQREREAGTSEGDFIPRLVFFREGRKKHENAKAREFDAKIHSLDIQGVDEKRSRTMSSSLYREKEMWNVIRTAELEAQSVINIVTSFNASGNQPARLDAQKQRS